MSSRLQRLREWSPLLPLLLLLLATYWLNQQVRPLADHPADNKRHDADIIATNFSATTLNTHGIPRFLLAAQRLEHFPDDDSTTLERPHLSSLYADHPPVYTSAMHGKISSKGTEIFLHDEVQIVRAPTSTQSARTFTTSYLRLVPDEDLAETDRAITVKDARNTLHAVGMRFNSKTGVVELLAQVKSQHENQ